MSLASTKARWTLLALFIIKIISTSQTTDGATKKLFGRVVKEKLFLQDHFHEVACSSKFSVVVGVSLRSAETTRCASTLFHPNSLDYTSGPSLSIRVVEIKLSGSPALSLHPSSSKLAWTSDT